MDIGQIDFTGNDLNVSSNTNNLRFSVPNSNVFSFNGGFVGIGTATPHESLSVNGDIRSKQVKVELNNWPDYVFKPSYNLPPLTEIKTYIDKYQHLPDMPSEAEVAKDGLNLGEINKLLTKKVEELTLYLIEKDKQLNAQEARLQKIENQLKALSKD